MHLESHCRGGEMGDIPGMQLSSRPMRDAISKEVDAIPQDDKWDCPRLPMHIHM